MKQQIIYFIIFLTIGILLEVKTQRTQCLNPIIETDPILDLSMATWQETLVTGQGRLSQDQAIIFDGNQWGTFPNTILGGEITFTAWVNFDRLVANKYLTILDIRRNDSTEDRILIRQESANNQQLGLRYDGTITNNVDIIGGTLTPGTWQHIAVSYNSEFLRTALFINGEITASITTGNPFDQKERDFFQIGYHYDTHPKFEGRMEELQLFNYALSDDQIKCLADICAINNCQICNNHLDCTVCQDGYFLNQDGNECLQCDIQCSTCTDTSNNCLICQSSNNCNSAPDCDCIEGYYMLGPKCVQNLRQVCLNPVFNRPYITQNDANYVNSPSFGIGKVSNDAVTFFGQQYGQFDTLYIGGEDLTISWWSRYDYTTLTGQSDIQFGFRQLDGYQGRLYIINSGSALQFKYDSVSSGQNFRTLSDSSYQIQLQEWIHYTIVQIFEENIIKIYINGEFATSLGQTIKYMKRDDNTIGAWASQETVSNHFIGSIDDFQVFKGLAISEPEIKCLAEVCSIENCLQCENHLICLECVQSYFLIEDQNVCQACDSQCNKCLNQSNECTECINTENRGSIPNCECNEGYYQQYQKCVKIIRTVCLNPEHIQNSILNLNMVNYQTTPTFIEGRVTNNAVDFQGSNYGTIFSGVRFGDASFTLNFWLIQYQAVVGYDGYLIIGEKSTGTPERHRFYMRSGNSSGDISLSYLTDSNNSRACNINQEELEWVHIAATYNHPQQYMKIYQNGNLVCTFDNFNVQYVDRSGNSLVGWNNIHDKAFIIYDEFLIVEQYLNQDEVKCMAEICAINNCQRCNNHLDCISCKVGYYDHIDNNIQYCLKCEDQCSECINTSDNCTICKSSDTGISGLPSCLCPTGSYLYGIHCVELKRNTCLDPQINNIFFALSSINDISWNSTPVQEIGIVSNNAYMFNGSTKGFMNKLFGGTSLTISFWLKLTSTATSGRQTIFSFKEAAVTNMVFGYVMMDTLKLTFEVKDISGTNHSQSSDIDVIVNEWQYWALVYDMENISLKYYNGGEVFGTFENVSTIDNVDRTIQNIGAQENTGINYMTGVIDEFIIFDRALDQDQIKCLGEICAISNCILCPNKDLCSQCALGYSIVNNGLSCQECNVPNCSDCAQDPNVCNQCADILTRDEDNSCSCKDGYYEINQPVCSQCTSPCLTCNTQNNCQSCISNNRQLPSCECEIQYFEENSICVACQFNCLECTTSFDNCTTCYDITRQNPPACECKDGFFEENNSTCTQCAYPCLNCTSLVLCSSCQDTNASLPDCSCNVGYYDTGVDCQLCQSQCNSCSNLPNNCLSCLDSTRVNPPDCNCIEEYFDDGINASCQECQYPCQNCSNSATSCLSCVNGLNRNEAPECDCLQGFYENNQSCLKCDINCLECQTSSSNCLTCFDSTRQNPPTCSCKDHFYQNENNNSCSQCQYPCINCSSQTICITCISPSNRGGAPECACNSGFFENGSFCDSCSIKCSLCINDANNCTQCSDSTRGNIPDCDCIDGYFEENNATCTQCSYPCENCLSATTCITCSSAANLQNPPSCFCQDNTYQQGQSCIECEYQCDGCTNSPSNCTNCSSITRENSPTCLCKNGYYDNDTEDCLICQYPCQNCSSLTLCISCADSNASLPSCSCNSGYYSTGINCSQCNEQCSECQNDPDNCISCSHINRNSPPSCLCDDGYFDDGTNVDCQQCSYPCQYCQNIATECITCYDNLNRQNAPICTCLHGYYQNLNNQCEQCQAKCLSCENSSDNCTACFDLTRHTPPQCDCIDGYYQDSLNNSCSQCQYPCENCSASSICTSCKTSLNRDSAPDCSCSVGYYDTTIECLQCSYKCLACSGTQSNCLSCSDITRQNLPDCDCQDGYYNNSTNAACLQCQDPCLTCSSINYCLTCINQFNRSPPDCECNNNTYLDGQNCTQCSIKCNGCQNTSDNCTNCSSPTRENAPLCTCKPNYYEINNQTNCQVCQSPCQECSSQSICISCISTENRQAAPSCQCMSGFLDISNNCVQQTSNTSGNTNNNSSGSNGNISLGNIQLSQQQFTWNIIKKTSIPQVYLNVNDQDIFSFQFELTVEQINQQPKLKVQLNIDDQQFYFDNTVTYDILSNNFSVQVIINQIIVKNNLIIFIENYQDIQDGEGNQLEDKFEEIYIERYNYYNKKQRENLEFQSTFTDIISNGNLLLSIQNLATDTLSSSLTSINYFQNILLLSSIQKSSLINEQQLFKDLQLFINFNLNAKDFEQNQNINNDTKSLRILEEKEDQSQEFLKNGLQEISFINLIFGQVICFSIIVFLHLVFILINLIQNIIYKNQKPLKKSQIIIKDILKNIFQYSAYHKFIMMNSQVLLIVTIVKIQSVDYVEGLFLVLIFLGIFLYIFYILRYILQNIDNLYYCSIPYYMFDFKKEKKKDINIMLSDKSLGSSEKSEQSKLMHTENNNIQIGFQHRSLWQSIKQIEVIQEEGQLQNQKSLQKYLVLYQPIYMIKQWLIIIFINMLKHYDIGNALIIALVLEIIQLFVILIIQPYKRNIDNLKFALIQFVYLFGLSYFTLSILQKDSQNQNIVYEQMQTSIILFLIVMMLSFIFCLIDLLYIPYAIILSKNSNQIKPQQQQPNILQEVKIKNINDQKINKNIHLQDIENDIENSPGASPTQSHRQFIFTTNIEENERKKNIDDAQELNNLDEIKEEENIKIEDLEVDQDSLHNFQEKFVNRRLAIDTFNFNQLQLQDFNEQNNYQKDLVKNLVFGHKINDQQLQKKSLKEGKQYISYLKPQQQKNKNTSNNLLQQDTQIFSQINSFCSDDVEFMSQFNQTQTKMGGGSHTRKHKHKKNFQNVEVLQQSQDHMEGSNSDNDNKQMYQTGYNKSGFLKQQEDLIKMNKTLSNAGKKSIQNQSVKQKFFKQQSTLKIKNIEQIQEQNEKKTNLVNSIYKSQQ